MRQPLRIRAGTDRFGLEMGILDIGCHGTATEALIDLASERVDWRLLRYFQARDLAGETPENSGAGEVAEGTALHP